MGGSVMVTLVYYLIYRTKGATGRHKRNPPADCMPPA
jgi:hypothetical protein